MGDGIRSLVGAIAPARVGLFALVLSVLALTACSDDDPKPGDGAFGTRCDEDKDCESLICAGLDGETKLCTEACTDPLGDECEDGFRCRRPDRKEGLVCICSDPLGCEREQPMACSSSGSCDDGIDCTSDSCVGDECLHLILPAACEVGSRCDVNEGCVENEPCTSSGECGAFADDCTQAWFCDDFTGRCQFEITDNDFDGVFPVACGGDDCDDFDSRVGGNRGDACDSLDNDCDGRFDEDGVTECGGMSCSFGECTCTGSQTDCSSFGGGCVDIFSDPFNCGGCGFVCDSGLSCLSGNCQDVDECSQGLVECPPNSTCANVFGFAECRCDLGFEPNASATECVDVNECSRGPHNCGSSECINLFGGFQCDCDPGFQDLGMGCTDVNECANGFDCGQGVCQNLTGGFQCACDDGYEPHPTTEVCRLVNECQAGELEGFAWCDDACRDVLNDARYCGSCSTECYDDSFCDNGTCDCDDAALTYCGTDCVDTEADEGHCGSCFSSCPVGATCTGGDCLCPGSATMICDNTCINTDEDELHCGGCFASCSDGATCMAGECVCPPEEPDMCGPTCFDFQTSEFACGDCDTGCNVVCNEGQCAEASALALGGNMGCVLFTDGRVGCFGNNDSGRLGRSLSTSLIAAPIGLLSITGVEAIYARDAHACALKGNGELWCWGENSAEQLAVGNTSDQTAPMLTRSGVAQAAVGLLHTCVVLQAAGKVECIGSDASGQRGDGMTSPAFGTWTAVTGLEHVDKLVSGQHHVCALVDGEVWCWGDNTSGQLGIGTSGPAAGLNAPTTRVSTESGVLTGVTDIAAGRSHTCAIAGITLYCWGENSSSQTGSAAVADRLFASVVDLGDTHVVMVAAGDEHTCYLANTGHVWCFGSAVDGQNAGGTTGPVPNFIGASPWLAVAAGSAHSCAIYDGGDFYCWGDGPSITYPFDTASFVRIDR